MSMMIGYLHNGEAYLASDEMATQHNLDTGEAVQRVNIGEKIVVVNDNTIVSVVGVGQALDTIKFLFEQNKRSKDMDIDSFIKELVSLCRDVSNMITEEDRKKREKLNIGGVNVIVAHYDRKKHKPSLYAFNDYDNFNIIVEERETGMAAKSAIPDEIMWGILKNIRVGSIKEYMRMAFMAVNNLTESVSSTFSLYKVGKKGVTKL